MTQADLPQLSLQRYLDLVKRRRWQLVPVSLLGLIVGGLIAFFIPRYFVAQTLLEHQQIPGEQRPDVENPFRSIVDTAKSTIPLAVGEALDETNWAEAHMLDPFERAQFERDIESRVRVLDSNAGDRSRNYAQLGVEFRDRDGDRSANFLNTLVRVWIQKRTKELREPALRQSQQAKGEADRWRRIYDTYVREKQDLEVTYGIRPDLTIELQRAEMPKLMQRQDEQKDELRTKKVARLQQEKQIERDEAKLADTAARVTPDNAQLELAAAGTPQGKALLARALYHQAAMAITYNEGSAEWHAAKRGYEMAMMQLRALVPQAAAGPDGLVPNPDYLELLAKIQKDREALASLVAEIELIEKEFEVEQLRLDGLKTGYRLYASKLTDISEAEKNRDLALDELRAADAMLGKLERELPVEQVRPAVVPPAPTEPNILIVALIGCILGLGAAIGLILLLDFMQGTFKTVDDVERGLHVPVLGGVSYLETEEQRVVAVRSRRRVSMVAAAALALITLVVTIFYVDPTRLPPVVRDLLAMLLGA